VNALRAPSGLQRYGARHDHGDLRVPRLRPLAQAPARFACIVFTISNSTTDKSDRSGKSSAPGRRSVLPASKLEEGEAPQSAGAERRTRWPALRPGRSLHRKGPPVHVADRRALRRFTAEILVGQGPTHPGLPGRPARRLVRPNPRAPHPAPSNGTTGCCPRMSWVEGTIERIENTSTRRPGAQIRRLHRADLPAASQRKERPVPDASPRWSCPSVAAFRLPTQSANR
jgi:hypothetical protein